MNDEIQNESNSVLLKAFQRGLKSLIKKKVNIEKAIEECKSYPLIREKGELLKCNLHVVKKGMTFILVDNIFKNPPVPIRLELDPLQSNVENLENYFNKAKKLEDGLPYEQERLIETQNKIQKTEQEISEFLINQDVEWGFKRLESNGFKKFIPVAPVKQEAQQLSPLEKSIAKIKSFYSCDGYWIYVGGNAMENETVSFRVGSGKDAWMHVANVPGSHVVVKLNHKGEEIPHSTLLEAALLAVHFSKYRDRANVSVTATTVNHVKKAKGAPVGTVYAHFTKNIKASDSKELMQKIIERTKLKKLE